MNYHNIPRRQINARRLLHSAGMNFFRMIAVVFGQIFPSLLKAGQSKVQATADLYPLGTLRSLNHLRTMREFFADAHGGRLPSFTIIDPDFGQWSEENPQDIQNGEAFSAKVVDAVMSGPGWPRTLLVWTYDEHGGYYDHVPPPKAPAPDEIEGQDPLTRFWWLRLLFRFFLRGDEALIAAIDSGPTPYDRLGFRVPAVIVSPYARPDYVTDTIYDHTSILKLIERKWNLPALTERDAWATDPLDAVDFENPPAFLTPPLLAPSAISIDVS